MIDTTLCTYHPLLLELVHRLESTGVGVVVQSADGHLFVQLSEGIDELRGAIDMKKEGAEAGVRIVLRKARKRGNRCAYTEMPMYQLYVLPIAQKNAQTITAEERRNMELNTQALRLAHAVERDQEQVVVWHERHEAHKRNPKGYDKVYKNFFGFVYVTIRMELVAAQKAEEEADVLTADAAKKEVAAPTKAAVEVRGVRYVVADNPMRRARLIGVQARARSIPLLLAG